MNNFARCLALCLAVFSARIVLGSVTEIQPQWPAWWFPGAPIRPAVASTNMTATFLVVLSNTSVGTAAPVCSAALLGGAIRTTPRFTVRPVEPAGQHRRWALDLRVALGEELLAPVNATLTVACADGTENATTRITTRAEWMLQLRTCADSGADECIASSVGNRACAYCGGQCVPFPMPYTCTRCGDGVVMPGEHCESISSRHCSSRCKCLPDSYPFRDRCRLVDGVAAVLVSSRGPLEVTYPRAQKAAAAIAAKCLAGVRAQATFDAADVVLAQDDAHPRLLLRVGELPFSTASRDFEPPSVLLRAVSSACVNATAAAEGLQARWGYYVADAGCGDGVVSGAEHCDSVEYCSPVSCRCLSGARPQRVGRKNYTGSCTPDPLYIAIRYAGPLATAELARAVAGQLASRCFDSGEVDLVEAAPSATQRAIRVHVVPAERRHPGARPPRGAVEGAWQHGNQCVAEVLRAAGLRYEAIQESSVPDALGGFEPAPRSDGSALPLVGSSASGDARHVAVLAPLFVAVSAVVASAL
eukprot:m51a1_g970 hypothetical protein (530) ;mRNA; f:381289-383090